MTPSDVENSQVERIEDLNGREQAVAYGEINEVSSELEDTSREKIKSEAEYFLSVLDYLHAVRAAKVTEKLTNGSENISREEIRTDIENFLNVLDDSKALEAVEATEELSNEVENTNREKIKSDVEYFIGSLDYSKTLQVVEAIEKLSNEFENASREKVKRDIGDIIEYGNPADDIIDSTREKYKSGQDIFTYLHSEGESDSSDSDYAIQDRSSSTSSEGESDSSDSDYERQIGDEYPENWNKLRKQAYKRDNYRCRNCGVGGGPHGDIELHAHHVVPVSAGGNHTLKNLYTLCETCHSLIHTHL